MFYIAVINTEEQPIQAIRRALGNDIKDNEDGESFESCGISYAYHQINVKEMPLSELSIYEVYTI